MIDRQNFKNFIDNVVATYKESQTDHNLQIDPFGNFEVIFEHISYNKYQSQYSLAPDPNNFANSPQIEKYGGGLGKLLFDENTHLHNFIKNINDVELNINAKTIDMPGASYALHRLMPMNSSPHIQMMWLNTKEPFIENVFVPWMKDNTLEGTFPLIKANLKITFPLLSLFTKYNMWTNKAESRNKIIYRYYGVRPIEVGLHKMTNEPLSDFYRKVTFDFDYFMVESDVVETIKNESSSDSTTSSTDINSEEELWKELDALFESENNN